jgi:hypothetical protein
VASASSLLEDTLGQTMLSTDGARQRQLRQPFSGPFAPKGVQIHMAAPIAAYVHDLVGTFSARGQADLKTAFADRLALWTVMTVLGLPIHDFPDRYIHNFCRKYATDPAYRADVENGIAPWVERNALFLKNLESFWWRETVGELPPNTNGIAQLQALFEEQFFQWICQHARKIVADPAYQGLKQLEQASEAACRTGGADAGMEEVVAAWNAIPGVVVNSSCQGASEVVSYAGKTLLVPSVHDECANVVVILNDELLAEVIEQCRSAFPHICSTQFYRPVGPYRAAPQRHCQLRSGAETDNTRVRQDLVSIALEVRAQWLR